MMNTLEQDVLEDLVNRYRSALNVISQFKSPEELREEDMGLPYEEVLEMAYENIIFEAMRALSGTF